MGPKGKAKAKKASLASSSQREPAQSKEDEKAQPKPRKARGKPAKGAKNIQTTSSKRRGAKKLSKADQAIQDKYFVTQQEDEAKERSSRQSTHSEEAMDDGEERDIDGNLSSFISSTSASFSDITYHISTSLNTSFNS